MIPSCPPAPDLRRPRDCRRSGLPALAVLLQCLLGPALTAASPTLLEAFDTDPAADGRFSGITAGTESSFVHVPGPGVLKAVLDVDASPASYLSQPFATPLTDKDTFSFSFEFAVGEVDERVPPTAFLGLLTPQHVENFGDGLTVNLASANGVLVAHASLDNAGFKDQGERILLQPGTRYLAVGSWSAFTRRLVVDVYGGPDLAERIGTSEAALPAGRSLRLTHLGLQNGGARTQDSTVGSLVLDLDNLALPGRPPVVLSLEDTSITEGTDGASAVNLTLRLSVPLDLPVSVDFDTFDGTATGGADYRRTSGTAVLPPGTSGTRITIPVVPDNLAEPEESFHVRLSQPVNALLGRVEAVVTILDDDFPTVSADPSETVEGLAGVTLLSVPIRLSNPSSLTVQVRYATQDGTARAGTDYLATNGLVVFPPGTLLQRVPLQVLGDRVAESNETLSLRLSEPQQARLSAPETTLTILDDDPVPRLDLGEASGTEGDAGPINLVIPVRLSNPSGVPVTVSFATADETARAGVDYLPQSGSLTFEPGQVEKTLAVVVLGDTLPEGTETFAIRLANARNAQLGTDTARIAILDDDNAPTLRVGDASTTEGPPGTTSVLTFPIVLEPPAETTVTVAYAVFPLTATAGIDYGPAAGTLSFAPGSTRETVRVTVVGDDEAEPDETLALRLGTVTGAGISVGDGEGLGTLLTDDGVTLTVADVEVTEPDGASVQAVFQIALKGNPTQPVTVGYFTANGSALAGQDYRPTSGQLTFEPGQNLKTVSVPVFGDRTDEPTEQFELRLNAPVGATLSRTAATATIQDNDPPSLQVADAQVVEGSSGPTQVRVVVRLSSPAHGEVRVEWLTLGRTATPGADFLDASGTLVFPAGTRERMVDVTVLGDTLHEADETFAVRLARPEGATLPAPATEGIVTIQDDDPAPRIHIESREVTECTDGTGSIVFRVTLSAPSEQEVRVNYASFDDTAVAGEDYEAVRGTLVFPPGTTEQEITVPLVCDTLDESTEGFGIGLGGPVGGFLDGDGRGRGTLVDDDPPQISVADVTRDEGDDGLNPFPFLVRLSSASSELVTVDFATSDLEAQAGTDYAAVSGTLVFPPGSLEQEIPVPVIGDTLPEGVERFRLTLTNPLGAGLARSEATASLLDDDQPRIRLADVSVLEGNTGTTPARLAFTLTRTSPRPVEVRFQTDTNASTAAAGLDYVPTNGVVRFAPNEVAAFADVLIAGDTLIETNESVVIRLSDPLDAELATRQATITLVDDDGAPVLTVADRSLVEPSPGAQALVFSLRLSSPSSAGVRVTVQTADATARAGADYSALRPTVVEFAPGITNRTVAVTVLPDSLYEPDETFLLVLSDPVNAVLARSQAVGSILNDDPPSLLRVTGTSLIEGRPGTRTNLVFRVTLSPPSSSPVSVAYTTLPGTATAGVDFEPSTGRVDFPIGVAERLVPVAILGDALPEDTETLRLELSDPVGAALEVAVAEGTVIDDDGIPLEVSDATVREGDQGTFALMFTVRLARAASQLVTVDFHTEDGTATHGPDYRAAAGTLSFPPGITTQTLQVEVQGDTLDEPDETVLLRLTHPVNAIVGRGTGTGLIVDDDPPVLSIDDVTVTASQTGSVDAVFQVRLTTPTGEAVSLNYRTLNGSATAGTDFTEITRAPLRFEPGETSRTLVVQVKGNTLDEATEFFLVELLADPPPVGARLGLRTRGRGTILNPLEANRPPTVALTAPADDTVFLFPNPVPLSATASDPENNLVAVEFFAGNQSLGQDSTPPYGMVWTNPPAGLHTLTARALDAGGLTATSAPVRITVALPNHPPTLAELPPRSTLEDVPTPLLPLTVEDTATPAGLLQVAVASANPLLVGPEGLALGGTGPDRTLRVTPRPDESGTATLTVTVRDPEGLATTRAFELTVLPVNDAPTLDAPPAITLPEDAPPRSVPLTGIGSGAANEVQALTVTAVSSNPSLIPSPAVTYTSPGSTGALSFQPRPEAHGTALITVTVRDDGGVARGGIDSVSRQFAVTVTPVNDPPTIDWISPAADATFLTGFPILLSAKAADPDDGVAAVEFLLDGRLVSRVSQPPYQTEAHGLETGTHEVLARVRDHSGASAETPVRRFQVTEPVRDLPIGDILIVRNHPAPEIQQLEAIITDSSFRIPDGLDRRLRPPIVVVADPENLSLERLLEFRLVIWDDLGSGLLSLGDREVDLFWQAWQYGIPFYLLGENLALPDTRLSAKGREQWYQLSGLAPGGTSTSPGLVRLQDPVDRPAELFSGSIPETLDIQLTDFEYGRPTRPGRLIGEGEVRALLDNQPVLVRYPAFSSPFDGSARRVVQSFLVTAAPEIDAQARRVLFLNGVVWLLGAECDNFASTTDCEIIPPDPSDPDPCAPMTFRVVVSNNGRCQVRGVRVTTRFPAGFQIVETRVSSDPEGVNNAIPWMLPDGIEFAAGRLSQDSQVIVEVVAIPPGPGAYTLQASTRALFRPIQECAKTYTTDRPGCAPPRLEIRRTPSGSAEVRTGGTGSPTAPPAVLELSEDLLRWTPVTQLQGETWHSITDLLQTRPRPEAPLFLRLRR